MEGTRTGLQSDRRDASSDDSEEAVEGDGMWAGMVLSPLERDAPTIIKGDVEAENMFPVKAGSGKVIIHT